MEYKHVLPADIEKTSMEIIEGELKERGLVIPEELKPVVKRVIHTTADFDYAENLAMTGEIDEIVKSFSEGVNIVTDTNMALSGISATALSRLGGTKECYMADPEISKAAKAEGTTRAVASMVRGAEKYPEGVFVVGNAPTALIKLSELIREGLRPTLIVGVPVGFVNVVESKEELLETCREYGVPAIVALGRKGGSNVAASICNAIMYMAMDKVDPSKRDWI